MKPLLAVKKFELQGQYVSKYTEHHRGTGKDLSTLNSESLKAFEEKWINLDIRMEIVCGKDVLRELRSKVNELYSVTLTDLRIMDEFDVDEIPEDLRNLITSLDTYRAGTL